MAPKSSSSAWNDCAGLADAPTRQKKRNLRSSLMPRLWFPGGPIFAALTVVVGVLTAVGWLGTAAREPARSTSTATILPSPVGQAEKLRLELAKLRLEVKKLQKDTSLEGQLRSWAPLTAALVALIGGFFGLWRYLRDQRHERRLRVEEDIAHNLDRLVEFPEGKSFGRVVATLRNLRALTRVAARGGQTEPTPLLRGRSDAAVAISSRLLPRSSARKRREEYRNRVTETLATMVTHDLTFQNPNQVRFATVCLTHWAPYAQLAADNERLCLYVLYRLSQILKPMAKLDHAYFSSVNRDDKGNYYPLMDSENEPRFLLFRSIVEGYEQYLARLGHGRVRDLAVADFERALQNPALAEEVAGAANRIARSLRGEE
jgi:hypothetical protein